MLPNTVSRVSRFKTFPATAICVNGNILFLSCQYHQPRKGRITVEAVETRYSKRRYQLMVVCEIIIILKRFHEFYKFSSSFSEGNKQRRSS